MKRSAGVKKEEDGPVPPGIYTTKVLPAGSVHLSFAV